MKKTHTHKRLDLGWMRGVLRDEHAHMQFSCSLVVLLYTNVSEYELNKCCTNDGTFAISRHGGCFHPSAGLTLKSSVQKERIKTFNDPIKSSLRQSGVFKCVLFMNSLFKQMLFQSPPPV